MKGFRIANLRVGNLRRRSSRRAGNDRANPTAGRAEEKSEQAEKELGRRTSKDPAEAALHKTTKNTRKKTLIRRAEANSSSRRTAVDAKSLKRRRR